MINRSLKQAFRIFVMLSLLIIVVSASAEEYATSLLATPADVEQNMGKWSLIDCRDDKVYAKGHIPGAISLGGACAKVLRDTTLRVKKTSELEKLFGSYGINMDKPVVVYSDARLITSATVAFWILEYLGHEKVYFLNGGIEAWLESGKSLDTEVPKEQAAPFKAKVINSRIATSEEMMKIGKGEIKDVNVIDSRTDKEFKGNDIRALRGGHIPNTTLNISHIETYDVQAGKMHKMDDLAGERLFGKLDRNKRTIAYCQTGTRSTLTYLELRLMGFKDPANYDDSWIVYGSDPDYPVESENWYDFVKVNDAMKKLDEMAKEIEELKKK